MMATPSSQFRRPEAAGDSRPIAWKQVPLRHCFRIISGATPSTNEPEYWDGDVVWVTPDDLGRADSRSITTSQRRITSLGAASIGQRTVPVKSLVLSTRAPIGHLGIAEVPMTTNQGCKSLAANPGVHAAYAYFQLLSRIDELRSHGTGTTFAELSRAQLARMPFWCPPIRVQQSIADFLDRETERIDALVAKKQLLIELLQEKRTALISHAVTKGLDPDAPMKDSGIEWLGVIPARWDAGVLRRAARLESGHTPSRQHPEYWEDCSIPWFTLADIWQVRPGIQEYVSETSECVSEVGLAHSSARLLPTGTVLLSRTASVGFSAIATRPMATSQDFANWVCGDSLLPEYLLYVYRSMRGELLRLTMGSTHKTIYMPIIAKLAGPLPPRDEQRRIVEHIRRETRRVDALSVKLVQAIERLREYRSALITAAVTGQIDVDTR